MKEVTNEIWYTIFTMWDKIPASHKYIKLFLLRVCDFKILHKTLVRELNKEV